jgi:hypothetical protein
LRVFLPAFIQEYEQRESLPAGVMTVNLSRGAQICFDAGHLEQILWNLIRNAWRYCLRQQGSIQIRLHVGETHADIEIVNDGPAITPEVRAHLFEPFYTTDKQGTGLGLYIARELAEANDAACCAMSIFPMAPHFACAELVRCHALMKKNRHEAPRVLLVDDEPDLLDLLEMDMARMGLDSERAGQRRRGQRPTAAATESSTCV